MNKLVTVITVAAVAALAGCKDQNYKPMTSSQNEAKSVSQNAENAASIETEETTCTCPKGTKHETPCACGASDCACVVVQSKAEKKSEKKAEKKADEKTAAETKSTEPEYTIYIVQRGDYLAKISKKFNITIAAIKSLNNMKGDTVRIGQKLKLPGKVDVGEQKDPTTQAKAKKAAAANADYTGETKEYVVKSGDTLGAIAYGHGINIRQLKKLNGLSSNAIKVGQKLKVPAQAAKAAPAKAEKKTAKAAPKAEKKVEKKAEPVKEETKADETPVAPASEPTVAPTSEPTPAATVTPAAPIDETPAAPEADATTMTYTVQEGDDLTGVSIRSGVSAAVIRELNNMPEDAQLTPGQVIKIPADAQ